MQILQKLEPENFSSHTVWILIYVKGYVSNCVYLIRQLTSADTKTLKRKQVNTKKPDVAILTSTFKYESLKDCKEIKYSVSYHILTESKQCYGICDHALYVK